MLIKTLRSNVKSLSWTLWFVILAFIGFIFVQWGTGGPLPKGAENTLLWVGRTTIAGDVFYNQLVRTLDQYQRQFKENFNRNLVDQFRIPDRILQSLVFSTIMENEAEKLHLAVSDAEVSQAIRTNSQFQHPDGRFIGVREYQQFLAYQHILVQEYEDSLRKQLLADKLKDYFASTLVIDNETLQKFYQKETDKVELEYVAFKPDELIKTEVPVTEAELAAYFERHRDAYKSPEKRSGIAVMVKYDSLKKEINISEKGMSDFFNENKETFRIPAKTKVSRILAKYSQQTRDEILKKVESWNQSIDSLNFAERAKTLSEDDKAPQGGDWGYWEWQGFSSQEKTMIERIDANAVSSPVDTGEAFSLLLVTDKVPEKQQTYGEVKERIRATLERTQLRELGNRRIIALYNKLKKAARLQDEAKSAKVPFQAIPYVANGENVKDIDPVGYLSQKLFSMKKGPVSEPFEMPNGMAMVQLGDIQAPQQQKLDEVKENVKAALILVKKLDLLVAKAADVATQLNGQKEQKQIDDLLKKENLKAEKFTYTRGDRLANFPTQKGLDDTIFNLLDNAYSQPIRFRNEIAIVKPSRKTITRPDDFAKNRDAFYRKKMDEMQNEYFSAYIMKKRAEYPIRFNNELYDKMTKSAMSRIK